jgi:rhodanese-related sulfurtransferase
MLAFPPRPAIAVRVPPPFQIVLIQPAGFAPARALVPTAEMLYFGLRRLGQMARIEANGFLRDGTNVVVGAHLLDAAVAATMPASTIVYNTEPVGQRQHALDALRPFAERFSVWDYSARNAEAIVRAVPGARVRVVEAGYTPEFTRVRHEAHKDVDVLFFGQPSRSRSAVLDALAASGLVVRHLEATYDRDRDPWLARARLVLALHFEPGTPFAVGRVVYPLSNRCAVVVERDDGDDIPADLAPGVALAERGSIVAVCRRLVRDDAARQALAERGFACIARRDFAASLDAALAAASAGHS